MLRHRICGVEYGLRKIRAEHAGVNQSVLVDIAPEEIDKKRRLLRQRSADVPAVKLRRVARLLSNQQRIARVENAVSEIEERRTVKLVGTRFGQDLDASESRPVELGRERVRIDANLANGAFGRKLPAAKA